MIKLWLWPIVLAILTLTGLISGLISDSLGDVWACIGLGIPVLIGFYFGFIRSPNP
jgi:hypothetical protein